MPKTPLTHLELSPLGAIHPTLLSDARLELHWAAQVAGAAGLTYVKARSDYSHTSLLWDKDHRALLGHPFGPGKALRTGLTIEKPGILLIDGDDRLNFDLNGQTLDATYGWLAEMIGRALGQDGERELARFDHEMPRHAVDDGGRFSAARPEHRELAVWYARSHQILSRLRHNRSAASPVRCWPHHFDLATLIQIDPPGHGEEARSIGVGMSPGDGSYSQPYWYVTPWPYPATASLQPLPEGVWHTDGWTGAVLTGSDIVDTASAQDQEELLIRFLTASIAASNDALRLQS